MNYETNYDPNTSTGKLIGNDEPSSAWTTRETVVIAVTSVVFGMLYLAWVQVWLVAQGMIGPLSMDILFGFWFAGSVFNAYVIRKPFVALATALIARFGGGAHGKSRRCDSPPDRRRPGGRIRSSRFS